MRAYIKSVEIADSELWPKNVQHEYTGRLPQWVLDDLPSLDDVLYDHIRSWLYDNEEEAYDTMRERLGYLFENKQSTYSLEFQRYVGENVSFVIVF